ncbi:MAG: hypothetical protein A4E47_00374 [Methanosaeta sp. PtaU1.Bin028]|nr:MAG: hypothetical protein A4E47_00374 [Methanosaeta sp. PtaU1.Bin028]
MIVHVPQVDACSLMQEWRLASLQTADHLTKRPDRFAQEYHGALEFVDIPQVLGGGIRYKLSFQVLNFFSKVLEDYVVVVHDSVQEYVCQVICAHPADAAFLVLDPLSNKPEYISSALLECYHEVLAEYQAELLCSNLVIGLVEIKHLEDYEYVVPKILHLRPLLRADDILHDERMDIEYLAQLLHRIGMDSVHLDPGDCGLVAKRSAILDRMGLLLLELGLIVIYYGDPGLLHSGQYPLLLHPGGLDIGLSLFVPYQLLHRLDPPNQAVSRCPADFRPRGQVEADTKKSPSSNNK